MTPSPKIIQPFVIITKFQDKLKPGKLYVSSFLWELDLHQCVDNNVNGIWLSSEGQGLVFQHGWLKIFNLKQIPILDHPLGHYPYWFVLWVPSPPICYVY